VTRLGASAADRAPNRVDRERDRRFESISLRHPKILILEVFTINADAPKRSGSPGVCGVCCLEVVGRDPRGASLGSYIMSGGPVPVVSPCNRQGKDGSSDNVLLPGVETAW